MKLRILTLLTLLISGNLMAKITTVEVINSGLQKIHNGDHPVALLEDKADFIGYDVSAGKINWALNTLAETNSLEDFVLDGGGEIKFKQDSYFSEKKVQRIVKRLKKKCDRFLSKINKDDEYYCSDVFVYSGDVANPTREGRYHKATGREGFDFVETKDKNSKPAPTRLKLASNNEPNANYDVYVIGVMEK